MIKENQLALVSQPWGVVLPVVAIALLTIGTSLVGDGVARAAIGIDRGRRRVSAAEPTVAVEGLRIVLRDTEIDIVDEVSFSIAPGEVLGLVGESGSGKTTVGLALLGHTRRGAAIAGGSIRVGDVDILRSRAPGGARCAGASSRTCRRIPAASLNPALRIGTQLRETLEVHGFGSGSEERAARIAEVMREVALPDDAAYLRRYPHELSGGQQQRIGLAMAFACRPRLIVLDEPTTGLDVTTQAHVLGTVRELAAAHRVAALYVSHDLAVVGTLADARRGDVRRADRRARRRRAELFALGLAPLHAPPRCRRSRTSRDAAS